VIEDDNLIRMEENNEVRQSPSSSPYQSLGDRPEMELDLWEGQFNLSSLQGLEGLEEGQYEDFSRGTSCWAEDSVVTMGTVHQLQEEVGQTLQEKRYQAVKQDNSELVRKIFVLEELLRDSELDHIQTKKEEGARIRDLESKLSLERKKNEDFAARIEYLEEENESLLQKSREREINVTNLISENEELSVKISDLELENRDQTQELHQGEKLDFAEEEKCDFVRLSSSLSRLEQSETDSGCHIQDSEELVTDLQLRLSEMETELRVLRDEKKCVPDRSPLTGKSLAEEIDDITTEERKSQDSEILELKNSLTAQEEVNRQLQIYIDAIILNIMEKNPELLEVQNKLLNQ